VQPRHLTALAHHCRFAFETAHPRFAFLDRDGRASVIITVNSGYE
jgi:hypothetical protein